MIPALLTILHLDRDMLCITAHSVARQLDHLHKRTRSCAYALDSNNIWCVADVDTRSPFSSAQPVNPAAGETALPSEPRKPLPVPLTLQPRLISREAAAAFVGLSVRKFDELVSDGRMPKPKRVDARVLWDVRALDAAVDHLDGDVSHTVDGARA